MQWSQYTGRIWIILKVSLKDLQDGLNLIASFNFFNNSSIILFKRFEKDIEGQETELYKTSIVPFDKKSINTKYVKN